MPFGYPGILRNSGRIFLVHLGLFSSLLLADVDNDDCERYLRTRTPDQARVLDERWAAQTAPITEIPAELGFLPIEQDYWLMGGQKVSWRGPMQEVLSPIRQTDGNTVAPIRLGSVPSMDENAAYAAYESARGAWAEGVGAWPSASMESRIRAIEAFVAGMKAERQQLITLLMLEIAKSRAVATAEVDRTIQYIEDTIVEARKLAAKWAEVGQTGNEIYQLGRGPAGVALIFAPYNYPLNETFTNLIPALIAGNSVVVKPAKWGVLVMQPLLEVFRNAFPPGVVNFIYGEGPKLFPKILAEGGMEFVGFIGGENGARAILRANARPNRTRAVLGLGAKNMAVLTEDALETDGDLDFLVKQQIEGALSFNGQRCTAHKILFVHRKIADRFLPAFAEAIDQLTHGSPWEEGVKLTASPDPKWAETQQHFTEDAVSKGAVILNHLGGRSRNGFFAPTLLAGVKPNMDIYNREQFGSVIPVVIYDNPIEPIHWQRQSQYGQQVAIYGHSVESVKYLYDNLSPLVCRVNINSACKRGPDWVPFEALKDSGLRPLSLVDALMEFTVNRVSWEQVQPGRDSILGQMREESAPGS